LGGRVGRCFRGCLGGRVGRAFGGGVGWCFRGERSHLQSSLPTPVSTGSGSTVSDDPVRSQPFQRAPVGSCNFYHGVSGKTNPLRHSADDANAKGGVEPAQSASLARLVQGGARLTRLVQGGAQLSNREPFDICGPS